MAAAHGLELTPIERSALSSLRLRRFAFIAQTLDPRISRSAASGPKAAGLEIKGSGRWRVS